MVESLVSALRRGEPLAAIDLGTSHAKALIAHVGPAGAWNCAGAATVCYTHRHGAEAASLDAALPAAEEALRLAGERAVRLSGRALSPIACAIAAPTRSVTLARHRHEEARPQLAGPIAAPAADAFLQQAYAAALRQDRIGAGPEAPAWLGPVWTTWYVDGRGVTSPVGFRAGSLAVEVQQAYTSSALIVRLVRWAREQGMVAAVLPEAVAMAQYIRPRQACVILDAGGQRSDLYLHTAAGELHCLSAPAGGHYFTRVIAAGAGLSPARAEWVKLAYAEGRLRARSRMKVAVLLRQALATWAKLVGEALAAAPVTVPGRWLVTGGHTGMPEFGRLPGALPDASMARLERFPSLEPLGSSDGGADIIAGPEALQPAHSVCLGLSHYLVHLARDDSSRAAVRRLAMAAAKQGFEVPALWLTS